MFPGIYTPNHHHPRRQILPFPTHTEHRTMTAPPSDWTPRNYSQRTGSPEYSDRKRSEYSGYNTQLHLIRNRFLCRNDGQVRQSKRTHQESRNSKPKKRWAGVQSWIHPRWWPCRCRCAKLGPVALRCRGRAWRNKGFRVSVGTFSLALKTPLLKHKYDNRDTHKRLKIRTAITIK